MDGESRRGRQSGTIEQKMFTHRMESIFHTDVVVLLYCYVPHPSTQHFTTVWSFRNRTVVWFVTHTCGSEPSLQDITEKHSTVSIKI